MKRQPVGGPALACPQCEVPLRERGEQLCCATCGVCYPVREGIARFNADDFYWGEISQAQMRAVVERARAAGWREAVRELVAPARPDLWEYITERARADFRYYLPFHRGSDVLDIGAGWGALTAGMAPHCRSLTALEGVEERLQFLQLRCSQEGLDNVFLVRSDFLSPPFAPAAFDVVVMNGVLEWAGRADASRAPGEVQRRFLRRVRRLLRPDGWLYVGIENRTGYGAWRGACDHSGLPFTSLLPRGLASVVTRLVPVEGQRRPYRTYTYTYWGYRRLLRSCGFEDIRIYAALPGYNSPRYLAPLTRAPYLRFVLRRVASPVRARGLAWAAGCLPLTAARFLLGSFAIFARRGGEC